MADRDNSSVLVSKIDSILGEYGGGDFHDYWELSGEVTEELPVRKFYIHSAYTGQSFYGSPPPRGKLNVALLTDDFIVDIEGNLNKQEHSYYMSSSESGSLIVTPLRSVESVELHVGSIQTLRESSNAKLILIAHIVGDAGIGKYWIAETDNEYTHLIKFGEALIEALGSG